jgi:hypothetical protein
VAASDDGTRRRGGAFLAYAERSPLRPCKRVPCGRIQRRRRDLPSTSRGRPPTSPSLARRSLRRDGPPRRWPWRTCLDAGSRSQSAGSTRSGSRTQGQWTRDVGGGTRSPARGFRGARGSATGGGPFPRAYARGEGRREGRLTCRVCIGRAGAARETRNGAEECGRTKRVYEGGRPPGAVTHRRSHGGLKGTLTSRKERELARPLEATHRTGSFVYPSMTAINSGVCSGSRELRGPPVPRPPTT